ncbi:LVIVD repeat-containing protein [Myceligenerans xiligouense]|uniref:LVIVD repeat-containing protein n=2 Tax=Myceligenerans xiligouense TaxID=253184 RepID=A0A3N4YQK5_9MICO|nr:LVIVD repeat-containing protein [Myceligenerans xiligouense]
MRRSTLKRSHLRGAAGAALSLTLATAAVATVAPLASAEPGDGAGTAAMSTTAEAAAEPDVLPGEVESFNMEHTSNVPKNGSLQSTGSDIAFQGKYAYAGNYDGFTVYDLSNPAEPSQALQVYCPGGQNDISVYKNILVLSTDSRRTDDSCDSEPTSDPENYWEGIKIWDISDPLNPRYVKSVATDCGSHTHSLAPTKRGKDLYVYVSSYFPSDQLANCRPPHDLISVVKIPTRDLEAAEVVAEPVLFPDGGYESPSGPDSYYSTSGCHDITTYVQLDLAAGACMGDGILLDISDREKPKVISSVRDTENFAFWHSATFNNDGTKVVFTDELGGGGLATCTDEFRAEQGANGIYDIERTRGHGKGPGKGKWGGKELVFKSYYKIPRINSEDENCVAHNGSLIPVKGKDLMVQSWYQGGTSVYDFTDSENPEEIAWFDRGAGLSGGGTWSSYYYNGYVYSNDLAVGFDTFELDPSIDRRARHLWSLNPQAQQRF